MIQPFQTFQPFWNVENIHTIPTISNIPGCSKSLPFQTLLIAECLEGKPFQLIWFTLPNILRSYNLSHFQIISAILPAVVVIFPKLLLLLLNQFLFDSDRMKWWEMFGMFGRIYTLYPDISKVFSNNAKEFYNFW